VTAGEIITREAGEHRATILPVDSEHSAIWQCLAGEAAPPSRIILTASGGPFRGLTLAQMEKVTPERALRHPSWKMGQKVTIDSATLLNKGLEVMEARWLFMSRGVHKHPCAPAKHRPLHGGVPRWFGQGAAWFPDMRLPIQYALTYPERLPNPALPRIDWKATRSLDFEPPDLDNFPACAWRLRPGKRAAPAGGAVRRRRDSRGALPGSQAQVHRDCGPHRAGAGKAQAGIETRYRGDYRRRPLGTRCGRELAAGEN